MAKPVDRALVPKYGEANNLRAGAISVDSSPLRLQLSPALCLDGRKNRRLARVGEASSLERLLEHVQLVVEVGVLLPLGGDLAYGVQHRRVIPPAEQLADLG